jgi:hypothetical protein
MDFKPQVRALLFVANICKINSNVVYVSTKKQPTCFKNCIGALSRLDARPTG